MKVKLTALLASRWHRAETPTLSTFMARVYNFYGRQTRHLAGSEVELYFPGDFCTVGPKVALACGKGFGASGSASYWEIVTA